MNDIRQLAHGASEFLFWPPDSTWHDLMLLMVVGTCLMGQLVLALLHLFEQCSDTHQRESEQLSAHAHTLYFFSAEQTAVTLYITVSTYIHDRNHNFKLQASTVIIYSCHSKPVCISFLYGTQKRHFVECLLNFLYIK